MPTIDLSEIYAQVKPWDLTLALDGAESPVRRLNSIDIAKLQRATSMSDDEARSTIGVLFDPPIDVNGWDSEKIALVVTAIVTYYGESIVKKKLADVRDKVVQTMTRRGA